MNHKQWIKKASLILIAGLAVLVLFGQTGSIFDFTDGSSRGNPTSGHTRLWGNSTTGKVECLDSSGLPCFQQTRRECVLDNDTQSATVLTSAQISGACQIPYAATITEVDVFGGTGTTGSLTTTGTSSINLQKYTPNGGATTTLLSGALATASGYACALTGTSGTCYNGTTSSSSITISTTSISAGDWIRISAATADGTQTWFKVAIVYLSSY